MSSVYVVVHHYKYGSDGYYGNIFFNHPVAVFNTLESAFKCAEASGIEIQDPGYESYYSVEEVDLEPGKIEKEEL